MISFLLFACFSCVLEADGDASSSILHREVKQTKKKNLRGAITVC